MLLASLWVWAVDCEGEHDRLISEGFAASVAAAAATPPLAAAIGNAGTTAAPVCSALQLRRLALQGMFCDVPCQARMLRTLADFAPQLTCLCIRVAAEATSAESGLQHALAAMTGLQQLTPGVHNLAADGGDSEVNWLDEVAPALQQLSHLTALDLAPGLTSYWVDSPPDSLPVVDSHVQLFPTSLVRLAVEFPGDHLASETVNMDHLSGVTQLVVSRLHDAVVLPPCIEQLKLKYSPSLLPVVESGPGGLRTLAVMCQTLPPVPEGLTQLSALHTLRLHFDGSDDMDWHWVAYLAAIPLRSLALEMGHKASIPASTVTVLGSCTQLTRLYLCQDETFEAAAVQELSKQIPRLRSLQRLQVRQFLRYRGGPAEAGWQVLLPAVLKQTTLHRLELVGCLLGEAVSKLCTGTHFRPCSGQPCSHGLRHVSHACLASQHCFCTARVHRMYGALICCCHAVRSQLQGTACQVCFTVPSAWLDHEKSMLLLLCCLTTVSHTLGVGKLWC